MQNGLLTASAGSPVHHDTAIDCDALTGLAFCAGFAAATFLWVLLHLIARRLP